MARKILGGAIVPAAPALVTAASPRQPEPVRAGLEDLRRDVEKALVGLPAADVVLVVDTGPRGIHQRVRADLASLGVSGARAELPVPAALMAAATRITQYPLVSSETLPVSSSVLVLLLNEVLGSVPVLVTTVPPGAAGPMLTHVGAGLVEAVRASDVTGVVVASGDLSAALHESSPGYVAPGAAEWDRALLAAVEGEDAAALHALGPQAARDVSARSWAAVAAGQGAFSAAHSHPQEVAYHAPLGVGQLVARFEPQAVPEPGERFRRGHDLR